MYWFWFSHCFPFGNLVFHREVGFRITDRSFAPVIDGYCQMSNRCNVTELLGELVYHSSLLRGERWPKESTFLEKKENSIIPACDPTKQSHLSHHDEVSIFLQPEIAIADEEHIRAKCLSLFVLRLRLHAIATSRLIPKSKRKRVPCFAAYVPFEGRVAF